MAEASAVIYGTGNTSGTTSGPTAAFNAMSGEAQMAAFANLKSLRTGSQAFRVGRNVQGVKQDMSAFSSEMKKAVPDPVKILSSKTFTIFFDCVS